MSDSDTMNEGSALEAARAAATRPGAEGLL